VSVYQKISVLIISLLVIVAMWMTSYPGEFTARLKFEEHRNNLIEIIEILNTDPQVVGYSCMENFVQFKMVDGRRDGNSDKINVDELLKLCVQSADLGFKTNSGFVFDYGLQGTINSYAVSIRYSESKSKKQSCPRITTLEEGKWCYINIGVNWYVDYFRIPVPRI